MIIGILVEIISYKRQNQMQSAFWSKKTIPILFRLFGNDIGVTSNKSIFLSNNLSFILPPNIVFQDSPNLLLKPNNYKLWKTKKIVVLMFESPGDLNYDMGQSTSALF